MFIEVTDYESDNRYIINTKDIKRIEEKDDCNLIIFYEGYDLIKLKVSDAYYALKILIKDI